MTDTIEQTDTPPAEGPEVVEVVNGEVIEPERNASGKVMPFQNKKGRGKVSEPEPSAYTEELMEKCRDIGIRENAITAGGDYRQLSKGLIYWLPLPELYDFEVKDSEIESDEDFWIWFNNFIDERKLELKEKRTKKKTKKWDDWTPTDWNAPQKISKWWSNWGYDSYGSSGSELSKQLMVALKAITTTVSVVNDTGKRYRVRLAQDTADAPMSATSFGEQLIMVSPQALLDTSIDRDSGIEVSTGWALHEASHVKYTTSLLNALKEPTELRPASVAHLLHNVLEDLRIEKLTGEKFPGFAEFFKTANDFMWNATKEHAPTTWGPTLNDKTNGVIMMAKHSDTFQPFADADPDLAAQWPWWREWAELYMADKEPIRMGVIRALERLAEDPQTKQEMDKLTEQEKELEKTQGKPMSDDAFKELLKKLKELLDAGGTPTMDPCPSPGAGKEVQVTLTDEQAGQLEKLISEEYQEFEAFYKMKDGPSDVAPLIEVSKPQEDGRSRGFYERPGGMAQRLREVFFFRKKTAADTERLLKTGFVDEEELWRVGLNDPRVFERTSEPDEVFTSVTMLVDASGSMIGEGLEKAQELANVMMHCLRTTRGVRTRVRAHTTGGSGYGQTCRIFRIWEPGDPDTRLGLLPVTPHGSNFDGFAIDWCAKELNDMGLPNEEKLLIVLSDGLPNGNINVPGRGSVHYGGRQAMDHMMHMGEYWSRQGVTIVQIAIDDDIRPEDQARMFKNWIGYTSDSKLLTDLTRLLIKTFGGIE